MNAFLNFLEHNDFEKRTVTLPEDAFDPNLDDDEDDAKEHYSDLAEFENQEYYLLNGFDSSGEMEIMLEKLFGEFKIYVLEANIRNNIEFSTEICNQLKNLHKEIEEETPIAKSLGSGRLEELYKKKLSYCKKAILFLKGESNQKRSTVFNSYKWIKDPDVMLPKAYKLMVGKFISANTTYEDFWKVFSYKPIGEVNPIKWYEDHVNGLIFFIVRLKERKIINDERGERFNHILLKKCFRNSSGLEFAQTSTKQTKSKVMKEIAPPKKEAIDELIKEIIS